MLVNNYLKSLSGNELALLCQQNNESAFAEICLRYSYKITNWITKLISCPIETAQDLTQDILIKIFLSLKEKQYRGEGFSSWIYTITRNEALNFFKKSQRYSYSSLQTQDLKINETPSLYLENKETEKIIFEVVNLLSEDEKLLLSLRLKNMKLHEISKITGLTYGSVSNKIKIVVNKIHKSVLART